MRTLSDEDAKFVAFHLACRLDDYAAEIRRITGESADTAARAAWSRLARISVGLNPSSLSGDWELLDGTIIFKDKPHAQHMRTPSVTTHSRSR